MQTSFCVSPWSGEIMKISKCWIILVAAALSCLAPASAFSDDALQSAAGAQPEARLPLATPVANWSAADETNANEPQPAIAPGAAQNMALADPASGACNTGACCNNNACGGPCGGLWVLAEATFLWPQLHRDFLSTSFRDSLGTETFLSNSSLGSANGSFLVAPRITLGFQGECWGVLTRYWNASTWGSAFAPTPNFGGGDPTTGIQAFDGFKAYTLDLEVQRRFCVGCWNLYGFGGVRYASVNNTRNLNIVNAFDIDILSASSFASQSFNGTGLTFGLWGISPLWDCSPFSLFFVNRCSVLWGTGKATSQTSASVIGLIGAAAQENGASASSTSGDMFIYEAQVGIQWTSQLRCLPASAFIRGGFEYQYWNNGQGLSTNATSIASVGLRQAQATASAGDFLFSLVGFNLGVGIMY
jgi:hypothetical protein